jgi:hypothetical protein
VGRPGVVPPSGRRHLTALHGRGEVWWCELPDIGRRPVVVLTRDAAIPRLPRALVAPCTTTIRALPSEVVLEPGEDPIPLRSAVNLDRSTASRSPCSAHDSAGLPTRACVRSPQRSPSRSTAAAEGRADAVVCAALAVAVDCRG